MEHLHRCACNPQDLRDQWKRRRKWSIRHEWIETPDAQRRWDRAYQYLLQWSLPPPLSQLVKTTKPIPQLVPQFIPQSLLEVEDDHDRTD